MARRTWSADAHLEPVRCAGAGTDGERCDAMCTIEHATTPFVTDPDESGPLDVIVTARMPDGWVAAPGPQGGVVHYCDEHTPPGTADDGGHPLSRVR
jgi:hypothetical protein